jgi:5-deoxy-D-glucuronate isomerase
MMRPGTGLPRPSETVDAFLRPETLTDPGRLAGMPAHRHDHRAGAMTGALEGHFQDRINALSISKNMYELEPRYGIEP